jgi:hypothetical protein
MSNAVESVENLQPQFYKMLPNVGPLHFAGLIAFIGGRSVISDLYDHRQDLLCNPIVKILILFCMLYMNIKHIKTTIVLFFIYILFIDNYIDDACNKEYFSEAPISPSISESQISPSGAMTP